ncbi:MAG: GNAT family N-acetyltransferase [Christensenellaceae bacterium]
MCFLQRTSPLFLVIYTVTGLTDVSDGLIARKTGTASKFGATLDSIADLFFYSVSLIKFAPVIWQELPMASRYLILLVILVKLTAYAAAAIKYRRFVAIHTVMNKLTGVAVFLLPYAFFISWESVYCPIVVALAVLSSSEELLIHLRREIRSADVKTIFHANIKEDISMRCTLREWSLKDAKDLANALSNKKILDNLRDGVPYPYTEQDAKEYINEMLASDKNDVFAFAICLGGKVVGSIGAFRQGNIYYRTCEIGYYLAEEYWGKGVMTDAVRRLCEMIFAETDILRIYAEPFADNSGSRRVLEKAGFKLEGILKNNASKNGKILDTAIYALTREPCGNARFS